MRYVRIISFILFLITLILPLTSCEKDREYNEQEVIAAAEELLIKAKIINEIYYGKGIGYDEDTGIGIYYRANDESLNEFGVTSIEDIKTKTLEVFSDGRAQTMFNTVLSSIKDNNAVIYSRYYQQTDEDGSSYIMVNTKYKYYLKGDIEYLSGIIVKDVKGEIIVIDVPVKLTSESGKIKNTYIEVEMIEESDGWRFASPCEAVYNESTDKYEQIVK